MCSIKLRVKGIHLKGFGDNSHHKRTIKPLCFISMHSVSNIFQYNFLFFFYCAPVLLEQFHTESTERKVYKKVKIIFFLPLLCNNEKIIINAMKVKQVAVCKQSHILKSSDCCWGLLWLRFCLKMSNGSLSHVTHRSFKTARRVDNFQPSNCPWRVNNLNLVFFLFFYHFLSLLSLHPLFLPWANPSTRDTQKRPYPPPNSTP